MLIPHADPPKPKTPFKTIPVLSPNPAQGHTEPDRLVLIASATGNGLDGNVKSF